MNKGKSMKVAITGGIGSGKSFVCKLLAERGITIYDCDSAAKRLMRSSSALRQRLKEAIGPDAYLDDGRLNKAAVAQFLLASEGNAATVDGIVHPAVARDFADSGMEWMECAILYESGFDRLVDVVVCVTAPRETRVARVMARDRISREKAEEWLAKQMPQEEVAARADFTITNDGQHDLALQIGHLLKRIHI